MQNKVRNTKMDEAKTKLWRISGNGNVARAQNDQYTCGGASE